MIMPELPIAVGHLVKVSKLLQLLKKYKQEYMGNGVFPNLDNEFEKHCSIPLERTGTTKSLSS